VSGPPLLQPTTKTNNNKISTRFIQVSINLTPTHYAKISDRTHAIYRTREDRTPPPGRRAIVKQMVDLQEEILRKLE
jgi:hypothetical protein